MVLVGRWRRRRDRDATEDEEQAAERHPDAEQAAARNSASPVATCPVLPSNAVERDRQDQEWTENVGLYIECFLGTQKFGRGEQHRPAYCAQSPAAIAENGSHKLAIVEAASFSIDGQGGSRPAPPRTCTPNRSTRNEQAAIRTRHVPSRNTRRQTRGAHCFLDICMNTTGPPPVKKKRITSFTERSRQSNTTDTRHDAPHPTTPATRAQCH